MVNQIGRETSDDIAAPAEMTVKQAGRRGGNITRGRYAAAGFYQRIGAKGGRKTAELHADLLQQFGRRGGRPRRPSLNESLGEKG